MYVCVCVCVQGQAYRYGYSVSAKLPASYGNSLSKFDMQEGTSKQWHEAGCIPVEPLMVPAPNAKSEDDGVVLSIVMGADGKSFLLCLDAGSFEELGRAHLPYGIPYGFHASFIPARA
jgi:carotenoid cleavage dioxygenase-like enzyme